MIRRLTCERCQEYLVVKQAVWCGKGTCTAVYCSRACRSLDWFARHHHPSVQQQQKKQQSKSTTMPPPTSSSVARVATASPVIIERTKHPAKRKGSAE